jgi:hypothetical protein
MTMTVTPVVPAPSEPGPVPNRGIRSVGYLVAAAILVVGVVGLVLLFGVHRPPPLDDVAPGASPAPPAAVAWTGWTGSRHCLSVIRSDGGMAELTCDRDGLDVIAWTDDGIVVRNWTGPGTALELVDPETGRTLESWLAGDESAVDRALGDIEEAPLDTTLYSRYRDGVLTVTAADGTELWRVEASGNYRVQRGLRAPDGSVVAAIDSSGRLLVLDPTGTSEPRVWRDGLDEWSRFVWEGEPLPSGFEPSS